MGPRNASGGCAEGAAAATGVPRGHGGALPQGGLPRARGGASGSLQNLRLGPRQRARGAPILPHDGTDRGRDTGPATGARAYFDGRGRGHTDGSGGSGGGRASASRNSS